MPRRTQGVPQDGDQGRDSTIATIEKAVASRWHRKDRALFERILEHLRWPYVGSFAGFSVYRVDSEWIKDNLDVTFGTGGHGLVHSFIPLDVILIDDVNQKMAKLVLHEAVEYHHMMEDGLDYQEAHEHALGAEQEAGDDFDETQLEAEIVKHCPERQSMIGGLSVAEHPAMCRPGPLHA